MTFRLTHIYTRQGDDGQTRLANGKMLPKHHARFRSMGEFDNTNALLGLLIVYLKDSSTHQQNLNLDSSVIWQQMLQNLSWVQQRIFDVGGELALPESPRVKGIWVAQLEEWIDNWNATLPPLENFILPGGSLSIAQAHLCRTSARSAERELQALHALEKQKNELLQFANRLSDFFFVLARFIAQQTQVPEVLWHQDT